MPENFYDIFYAMQLFYRNTGITIRTAVTSNEERSIKLGPAGP